MLTKFRNFTDRLSQRFVHWLCPLQNYQVWSKDDEIEQLNERLVICIQSAKEDAKQMEIRIQALTERNTELEQANENLIIQRAEVRKLVEQLNKHFPHHSN